MLSRRNIAYREQLLSTRLIATIIDRSERDDQAGRRLVICVALAFAAKLGSCGSPYCTRDRRVIEILRWDNGSWPRGWRKSG